MLGLAIFITDKHTFSFYALLSLNWLYAQNFQNNAKLLAIC